MTEVKGMSQEGLGMKVLIDTKIGEKNGVEEYASLIKDGDINEFYLIKTLSSWKQISDTQKAWDLLIRYKYYVQKDVVPLIYFILSTNPLLLNTIFEFLYENGFIMIEQDE